MSDFLKKYYNKYNKMSIVAKASIWFLICNILQKGLSIITTPIFTRWLTTEEYGLLNSYSAWMSIFLIFTSFKLNYGVYNKGMSKFSDQKNEYNASMQFITTILTTIFAIIYFLFQKEFNSLTGLPTIVMIFMIVQLYLDPAVSFWSLRERYDFKYKKVVLVTLAMSILSPVVGFIAVQVWSDNAGNAKIISGAVVAAVFGGIIYIVNIKKSEVIFKWNLIKFAMIFNLPLIPHYLSEYVLEQSDRVMIQKICSQTALGLYSVAYNAGMVLKILVSSLNSALIPWLYRKMEEKNFDQINRMMIIIMGVLAIPLCLFMLVAPEIVRILAAPQYMQAILVIPPVATSILFVFLFGIYGNIEFFYDKNKFTMYVSFGAAILNVILNWIFIPLFGYIAAAYTTLIGYTVLCISHAIFMEHISNKINKRNIFKEKYIWGISLICIILSVIISFLYSTIIIRYVLVLIIFLCCWIFRKKLMGVFKQLKNI